MKNWSMIAATMLFSITSNAFAAKVQVDDNLVASLRALPELVDTEETNSNDHKVVVRKDYELTVQTLKQISSIDIGKPVECEKDHYGDFFLLVTGIESETQTIQNLAQTKKVTTKNVTWDDNTQESADLEQYKNATVQAVSTDEVYIHIRMPNEMACKNALSLVKAMNGRAGLDEFSKNENKQYHLLDIKTEVHSQLKNGEQIVQKLFPK
ncbi:MAG: hypothetical protein ACXVCY_15115 [Pseudobdellovibrionaceae bacterium]